MKTYRIVAAIVLGLLGQSALAYQIVEGRYRVETAPGTYQDQLVVRCDDGRLLTVVWETKLAEACGEGLMGGPAPKSSKATPPATAEEQVLVAVPAPAAAAGSGTPTAGPATLLDDDSQKRAMLAQIRAQFGDVPERYVEFKPGAGGLSMRLLPPLNEIVKKYEVCRRNRDARAECAAERDRAIAKLSDQPAQAAAVNRTPAKPKSEPKTASKAAAPAAAESHPAETPAPAKAAASESSDAASSPSMPSAAAPAASTATAPAAPAASSAPHATPAASGVVDRAAAEQKIAEEHAWCMRAKPKFECEQARARALAELDHPAKPVKAKRSDKQAAAAPAGAVTPAAPARPVTVSAPAGPVAATRARSGDLY